MFSYYYFLIIIFIVTTRCVKSNNNNNNSNKNHTNETIVANTTTTTPTTTIQPVVCGMQHFADIERHSSFLNRVKRIINGVNARMHSWPWLVSFQLKKNRHHFCSGFLISDSLVLTAAHCLSRIRANDFHIVAGIHELNSSYRNVQLLHAKSIIMHEKFDRKTKTNDIALIRLAKAATLTPKVSILCLPESKQMIDDELVKKLYIVAGWGQTNLSVARANSNILQQTKLRVLNSTRCVNKAASYRVSSTFCTINRVENSNICYGDSGVPLMTKHNGQWYAYGIASYAPILENNICENTKPSYFTNLFYYQQWIQDKISNNNNAAAAASATATAAATTTS